MAEKKLDRARSMTVAKLEKQYILGASRPGGDGPSSATREETATPVNGAASTPEKNSDLEETYNKTLAVSQKQREQLDTLEAENAKLTSEITALNVKVGHLRTACGYSKVANTWILELETYRRRLCAHGPFQTTQNAI